MDAALHSFVPADADIDYVDFFRCVRRAFAAFEREHPRLAALLCFRHVEEMSLAEIAAAAGGSPNEAKARLFSARSRFRPTLLPCLQLWPRSTRRSR